MPLKAGCVCVWELRYAKAKRGAKHHTFSSRDLGMMKIFSWGYFWIHPERIAWHVSKPTKSASWWGPWGIPEIQSMLDAHRTHSKKTTPL